MNKTKLRLLNKCIESPRGIISVVYAEASSRRSKNSFGLREKRAALDLEKQGYFERYHGGGPPGRGVMSFRLTEKGRNETLALK